MKTTRKPLKNTTHILETLTPNSARERWALASERNEGVYHEVSEKIAYKGVPLDNKDFYFPVNYTPKATFVHNSKVYIAIAEIIDPNI